MAEGGERTEESRKRAELFDTLSHQTRIRILKALEAQPLSFAELKKLLSTESSGYLQHHLGKLGDLIKQTEDGKYALSDDGREAMRVLNTIRVESSLPGDSTKEKAGYDWWAGGPSTQPFRLSLLNLFLLILPLLIIAFVSRSPIASSSVIVKMFGAFSCFAGAYLLGTLVEQRKLRSRFLLSLSLVFLSLWMVVFTLANFEYIESSILAIVLTAAWIPLYLRVASDLIRAYEGKPR